MRTYCKPKDVNIEDLAFIKPAVHRAFSGKLKKSQFRNLLLSTGKITKEQLAQERRDHSCNQILIAIDGVAEWAVERIRERDLQLKPVRQFTREDGHSGKVRDICQESPEQQVFEYIAKYSLEPLFRAKLLHCQYGSIPGKGQLGGKRRIERMIRKKFHGKIDEVKCDIKKAYPSTTVEMVMNLLRRDIGKKQSAAVVHRGGDEQLSRWGAAYRRLSKLLAFQLCHELCSSSSDGTGKIPAW